jgi:NADH dehydrogenase [ubiquinone] 1 alpha subcomplex assembly factor 6
MWRLLRIVLMPIKVTHFLRKLSNSTKLHHALTYCREMVQKYDYEGYLCILYIPRWAHATQYALRAFNIEISRIQEQTRQLITAQMRMQFWKDTLDAIYQEVRSMG